MKGMVVTVSGFSAIALRPVAEQVRRAVQDAGKHTTVVRVGRSNEEVGCETQTLTQLIHNVMFELSEAQKSPSEGPWCDLSPLTLTATSDDAEYLIPMIVVGAVDNSGFEWVHLHFVDIENTPTSVVADIRKYADAFLTQRPSALVREDPAATRAVQSVSKTAARAAAEAWFSGVRETIN